MSTSTIGLFVRHLAVSEEAKRLKDSSDRDLLAAYQGEHSEAAFTELMRRYGPLVLRTCRRILGPGPDTDDVFQATFILLARKAGQLGRETAGALSLGGWLHRVAYQSALNAVTETARRKAREQQANVMAMRPPSFSDPAVLATWNEIQPILDAELDALPEQARKLLIACYLQEKTRAEMAAELGLPPGSIGWHLQRARTLLAARLARRGITVSSILLAVLLGEAAKGAGVLPAVLLVHTVEAARRFSEQAVGIVSDNVARLVNGGLAQMARGWTHWSMALAAWVSLLGAGLIACQTLKAWPDKTPDNEPPAAAERPARAADNPARVDCFGDPLPPGALARMGTVRLFNGERDGIQSWLLAFSPNGKILASPIGVMTVALWDATTGKEIRRLTTETFRERKGRFLLIASLGFSPDGKALIAVTPDQRVCLWEVATGKLLRTMDHQDPKRDDVCRGRVAFLPDGRMLAAAEFRKAVEAGEMIRKIYVWDVATGKEIRQLSDLRKNALFPATAFSQDGKLLATADKNNISLWDVTTGKEIRQLTHNAGAANDYVRALAFSHDGKMLAVADLETVFVREVTTGKLLRQLKAPGRLEGSSLAFSPDGKILVGGKEGHLWEVSTGKEIRSLGLKGAMVALFSPDGRTLALRDEAGAIRLWNVATGKEIFPRRGHRQRIRMVVYSPDGKTLASIDGSWGEPVRLWDVATGKELRQLPPVTEFGIESIAYSPDGKVLATTEDTVLSLLDTATGKVIRHFEEKGPFGGRRNFWSVTFSPDGKRLGTDGLDVMGQRSVVLWEAATGKEVYQLNLEDPKYDPGPSISSRLPTFSPDGRLLALHGKNTVFLWEAATGKPVGQLDGPKPPGQSGGREVRCLAFSPDSRVLATSSFWDDKIRLWEVASGKEIGQLGGYKHRKDGEEAMRGDGCVLTFSSDGRMLAIAEQTRYIFRGVTLWEVATGKEIGQLAGHRNVIRTLAFAPDGKTLASAGDDLTCLIWDVASVAGRLKPAATDALASKSLSKEQLEAAWADLANTDPAKAYRAVSVLRAAPEQAVLLLKERVQPAAPITDPKQLARWIADLDDEDFAVREKAQRAIERLGEPVIPALRRALADQPSLEMKQRLRNILAAVELKLLTDSSGRLWQIRAVQVLESIATPEAQQVLRSLAKGVAGANLTHEAQAALERLARRPAPRP